LPLSDQLFDEAAIRGMKVKIKGKGVNVKMPDGSVMKYADQLEAMEAITRVPLVRSQPSIDEPIARAWNMGIKNGLDSWTDSGKHMPTNFYDAAVAQLYGGDGSLVHFTTTDIHAVDTAMKSTEKMFPTKYSQIQRIELTPANPGGEVAMFDPAKVSGIIANHPTQLKQLGVTLTREGRPVPVEDVIRQLHKMPSGLDILMNKDTESAIMTTWYKQHSMIPNLQKGAEQLENGRPIRLFSPEQKSKFEFRMCK